LHATMKREPENGLKLHSLRVPRVVVWACFRGKDEYGRKMIKAKVVFWGLNESGEPVGLVISNHGRPEPAESFSNFVRFEYSRTGTREVFLSPA